MNTSNNKQGNQAEFATHDHYWDGPVHSFFSLTYSNYLVLNRAIIQSMPLTWQTPFVDLLEQIDEACVAIDMPDSFDVSHGKDRYVNELSAEELKLVGIEEVWDDEEENSEYMRDGKTIDGDSHVIVPCPDPVPHYKDYTGIAAMRSRMKVAPSPASGGGQTITSSALQDRAVDELRRVVAHGLKTPADLGENFKDHLHAFNVECANFIPFHGEHLLARLAAAEKQQREQEEELAKLRKANHASAMRLANLHCDLDALKRELESSEKTLAAHAAAAEKGRHQL